MSGTRTDSRVCMRKEKDRTVRKCFFSIAQQGEVCHAGRQRAGLLFLPAVQTPLMAMRLFVHPCSGGTLPPRCRLHSNARKGGPEIRHV